MGARKGGNRDDGSILICGGAGYIGSHMVRCLLSAGRPVVVLDDLSTGHLRSVPEGVEVVRGTVADRALLDRVLRTHSIAAAMHFCASIDVGESVADPRKYYRNNVASGLDLLEALLDHGVRRIVFSSSCTVYGHPDQVPINESCPVRPFSPYGRTKAMFEKMLADFGPAYGLQWASLRYFNAAGASLDGSIGEDHDPETHLIPLVLRRALAIQRPELFPDGPRPLVIFGQDYPTPDGTCVRDYVHVLDLAAAHVKALDYLAAGGESRAFNLANERGFSVKEIIALCGRVTGVEIPYEAGPRRPGDLPELVGSARLAREVLGWRPEHSEIDTIVRTAWKWHATHPRGFAE